MIKIAACFQVGSAPSALKIALCFTKDILSFNRGPLLVKMTRSIFLMSVVSHKRNGLGLSCLRSVNHILIKGLGGC